MSETPQEVREIAGRWLHDYTAAVRDVAGLVSWEAGDEETREYWRARADAGLLAAVTPVIRRQEREKVAEEIRAHAAKYFPKGNLSSDVEHARWRVRMHLDIAARIAAGPMALEEAAQAFAAAIARSHSTQPETGQDR